MDITPVISPTRQAITGYGAGIFKINGQETAGSLLISPTWTLPWAVTEPAHITLESLLPLLENPAVPVELLLIGTGSAMTPPPADLRAALRTRNIALEFMDTGAACRTYNVLLGEERRVGAALIAL